MAGDSHACSRPRRHDVGFSFSTLKVASSFVAHSKRYAAASFCLSILYGTPWEHMQFATTVLVNATCEQVMRP